MKSVVVFILFTSFTSPLFASYFESLRYDTQVPIHCQLVQREDFTVNKISFFTMGIAAQSGFDYKYKLRRQDAAVLWEILKNDVNARIQSDRTEKSLSERGRAQLQLIRQNYKKLGFDFASEGEVLEALVLLDYMNDIQKVNKIISKRVFFGAHTVERDNYYATGSITYSYNSATRTIGELDIVIARKSDCKVLAVGEAKLGHRGAKARRQMERFQGFLRNN